MNKGKYSTLITFMLLLTFLLLVSISYSNLETASPKTQNTIRLQKAFPNLPIFSSNPGRIVTEMAYHEDKIFVVLRNGYIYMLDNSWDVSDYDTLLNIENHLGDIGGQAGLFGLAFSPDFKNDGLFYLYYVRGNNVAYVVSYESENYVADTSSATVVMEEMSFYPGHYGGKIAFGPDDYLCIATGDAGNGTDTSGSHARRLTNIWGKLLRINVSTSPYTIPATNPFCDSTNSLIRKEIFAWGFRNLWKFSFDSAGAIWGGDVGEKRREEINIIKNGKDYGWNKMEGELCFPDSTSCDTSGLNLTPPILTYNHNGPTNRSGGIVGGYVSYGNINPTLRGKYLYGDINQGTIWSYPNNVLWDTTISDNFPFFITFGQDIENIYISRIDANQPNAIFRIRDNSCDVNYDGYIDLIDILLVYSEALNYTKGISNCDVNLDYVVDNTDLELVYNGQAGEPKNTH